MRNFKPLGVVRRIDSLGRIVMPIELRRTLGMRDGDPLEMFSDGEGVYIKKYEREKIATDKLDELKNYLTSNYDAVEIPEKLFYLLGQAEKILHEMEARGRDSE